MSAINSARRTDTPVDIDVIGIRLRRIYATAVAVRLALCCQAAEQDFELAEALRCGVCDVLGALVQEFNALCIPKNTGHPRPRQP